VNAQIPTVVIVRRTSLVRAARVLIEYGITIGIALLASYLILGGRW
jgi:hypothetical protein